MTPGLFVTGTDTGVGKTAVAAALARILTEAGHTVRPVKPVETGCPREAAWPRDAACLADAVGGGLAREAVCPVTYREPLAPRVAAERTGRPVEIARLDAAVDAARAAADVVLVEGAGGLLVPVTDTLTIADLAARWGDPVLVVARAGLGTLNHTALTVEHARAKGLDVAGIVINRTPDDPDVATRTNPTELERLTGAPVLAQLPKAPSVDTAEGQLGPLPQRLADRLDPEILFDRSRSHAHA